MDVADRLTISVAQDGLTATLIRRDAKPVEKGELSAALAAAGVLVGVDGTVVTKVVAGSLAAREVVIARGKAPLAGKAGAYLPAFDADVLPGKIRENGSIDFRDRESVKSVAEGDILGTVTEPTKGEPGQRVDGKPVSAAEGKALSMKFGPGVSVGPDGVVRSLRSGVLSFAAGVSLDVTGRLLHKEDVDFGTGDLKVEGDVLIRGAVTRTFTVAASGEVEIQEGVDGGSVYAGGDLQVRGIVRSSGTSIVWGTKNVVVRGAESGVVCAAEALHLGESLNSHLSAKRIQVSRRLRGGVAAAEEALIVEEAGAPDGTPTILIAGECLGSTPEEVLAAVQATKKVKEGTKVGRNSPAPPKASDPARTNGSLGRIKIGSPVPVDFPRGDSLPRIVAATGRTKEPTAAELEQKARRDALAAKAFVHVSGKVCAGVVVQIGSAKMHIDHELRATRFTLNPENGRVEAARAPALVGRL